MNLLVVGLGSIGRRHARNWAALGLGEVWMCQQAGRAVPNPRDVEGRVFPSLDAALAAGPDVVVVSNPTSLHVPTAQAAVDAGCHVLMEKPLGASLAGVADLLAAAERQHVQVMVGYNLRFHPGLARLRDLLHAGAIGRPLSARAEMGEYLPGWHPGEDYRQSYSGRADLGGGPVLTFSHELDALCWLLGRPARITCLASHVSSLEITTEDVAEMAVQFAGGTLASVHVDYLRRPPRRSIEILGEGGILRWEYDENRLLVYAPATREWRVEAGDPRFERNDMFLAEARAVAARVAGGADPVVSPLATAQEGAAILALALAALGSAAEGRTINLESDEERAPWLKALPVLSP